MSPATKDENPRVTLDKVARDPDINARRGSIDTKTSQVEGLTSKTQQDLVNSSLIAKPTDTVNIVPVEFHDSDSQISRVQISHFHNSAPLEFHDMRSLSATTTPAVSVEGSSQAKDISLHSAEQVAAQLQEEDEDTRRLLNARHSPSPASMAWTDAQDSESSTKYPAHLVPGTPNFTSMVQVLGDEANASELKHSLTVEDIMIHNFNLDGEDVLRVSEVVQAGRWRKEPLRYVVLRCWAVACAEALDNRRGQAQEQEAR